jgi:hypothetical protein
VGAEGGSQKPEARSRKSEVGSQRTDGWEAIVTGSQDGCLYM